MWTEKRERLASLTLTAIRFRAQVVAWDAGTYERKISHTLSQVSPSDSPASGKESRPIVGLPNLLLLSPVDHTQVLVHNPLQITLHTTETLAYVAGWAPTLASGSRITCAAYTCDAANIYVAMSDGALLGFDSATLVPRYSVAHSLALAEGPRPNRKWLQMLRSFVFNLIGIL